MTELDDFNSSIEELMGWLREMGFPTDVKDMDKLEKEYSDRILILESKLLSAYASKEITEEEYKERCIAIDDVSSTVRSFVDKKRKEKIPPWFGSMMNPTRMERTKIRANNPEDIMTALPNWLPEEQKRDIVSMIKEIVNNRPFDFFISADKDDDNNKW